MVALQAPSIVAKGQTAERIGLGDAVQLEGQLGDDAERSLRADEEASEVVAARGLPRAIAGLEQRAVGHDRGEAQHVIAHGAVAHGVGAGGPCRSHAAKARVGARIDGEEETFVAQMFVERFARDAGFDHAVEILRVHGEDAVHMREVERNSAEGRVDLAFKRGAGAEGNDRHARLGAKPHHFDHLLRRLGEDHGVGRLAGDPGERVGMLLAERGSGREAIAEPCRKPREQGSLRLGRGPLGASAATMLMAAVYHPCDSREVSLRARGRA